MRYTLTAALILCAAPALAAPQTPIAFETIVDLDKFRVTNVSPSAQINQMRLRPFADNVGGLTKSDPDIDIFRMPNFFDYTPWVIAGGWRPNLWVEFAGHAEPNSTIEVLFIEPATLNRGSIFVPFQTGRFEGLTIPEPGMWVLGVVGLAILVAWRVRYVSSQR